MKLTKYLRIMLSIPKTILFNFKVFKFKTAIKLPVFVSYDVNINKVYRNCIIINGEVSMFMIKVNIGEGSLGVNNNLNHNGFLRISKNSILVFNGRADFAKGISIRAESGKLIFGDNFSCNRNCFISCSKGISFGDNVLIGWSVNFRDSDGHKIYNKIDTTQKDDSLKPVLVGNNVWIGSYVDILKGSIIKDNCVVGYRSCVTKSFDEENCIIAGYPAKVVKKDIEWEI